LDLKGTKGNPNFVDSRGFGGIGLRQTSFHKGLNIGGGGKEDYFLR